MKYCKTILFYCGITSVLFPIKKDNTASCQIAAWTHLVFLINAIELFHRTEGVGASNPGSNSMLSPGHTQGNMQPRF